MSLENPRFFSSLIFQNLSTPSCFNFSSIKMLQNFMYWHQKSTLVELLQILFPYQKVSYQRKHGIYICFFCFTKDLIDTKN